MSANDLIQKILDGNRGNLKETILDINELVSELLDENINCQFGIDLSIELEDFAIRNNVCPNCGCQLMYKVGKENSEYFGLPVTEEITDVVCPECGCGIE